MAIMFPLNFIIWVLVLPFDRERAVIHWLLVYQGLILSWLIPFWKIDIDGREKIDRRTTYVIISNHQSLYDIFLIYGWLGIDIKWVMKKELRKIPGVGFGSRKVGHIFLDRSNRIAAVESLNEAKRRLVSGTSVVMFPEGTRSVTGKIGTFKRGAFKLALDLGLPILPLTLVDTIKIMPTNTLNIMPGRVKMIIHEPIDIKKYTEETLPELIQYAKEIIGSALPG